ncbi:ribokinase [Micromonospora olivasterospora]|uniref:Ribokinase n=1 Tax=Micromonospora olivasterospora TaxID=1880 RepID=A0A562II52_MICOL|nr:ribokinase [Micromonospora olivasterospora]TWH70572.1 ribokinase [Micromonospora olivasterospora]
MSDLLVVGSVNLDEVYPVPELPIRGETVLAASSRSRHSGGKGGNQAVAAATRTGVAFVGAVGDDEVGEFLRADLTAAGVDTTHLVVKPAASGTAVVIVEQGSGDNSIVVDQGANLLLDTADVPPGPLATARVVLLQLEIPLKTARAVAERAAGLVVLNPAPMVDGVVELLDRVDVLVPNEFELRSLLGRDALIAPDEAAAAVREAPGYGDVVATFGGAGAYVYERTRDLVTHIAPPAVRVLDTTGAGDCLCGVLAAELAAGAELVAAAETAVCVASLSTTRSGARWTRPVDDAELDTLRSTVRRTVIAR